MSKFFKLFRITLPLEKTESAPSNRKRKAEEETPNEESPKEIYVEPYIIPNRGPYPYNKPKM